MPDSGGDGVDLIAFAELVKTMRDTQKQYFRVRAPNTLERSKMLEKEVDHQVEKILTKQSALEV